jgi:hypothetical protein
MWLYSGNFQTDTLVVITFFIELVVKHDNDIGAQAVTRDMVTRQDKMNKNYAGMLFTKIAMNWIMENDQINTKSLFNPIADINSGVKGGLKSDINMVKSPVLMGW